MATFSYLGKLLNESNCAILKLKSWNTTLLSLGRHASCLGDLQTPDIWHSNSLYLAPGRSLDPKR